MNKNIINKKVIKNKITAVFIVIYFLFSQFVSVKNVYAFTDINQFLGNVVDWAKAIDESVGGVISSTVKASLSTALNEFAKDLATKTVSMVSTGDWGQEPLYFNFSFEDTLKQAVDNASGTFLDQLIEESGFDLCKPADEFSINWKFKLMLNVIPDLSNTGTTTVTTPKCTVSKFIDSVKTSIDTVIGGVQKALAKDCFSEFESDSALGYTKKAGSLLAFDINSLKGVYGYDSSVIFCKKIPYYMKNNLSNNQILGAYTAAYSNLLTSILSDEIKSSAINSNYWTTNKSDCLRTNSSTSAVISGTTIDSKFTANDGSCLLSFKYCKFQDDGSMEPDKVKQKKFINQYNTCYLTKVKEALGSLVEFGSTTLPIEKIAEQKIGDSCKTKITSDIFGGENGYVFAQAVAAAYKNYDLSVAQNFAVNLAKYVDIFVTTTTTLDDNNIGSFYIYKPTSFSDYTTQLNKFSSIVGKATVLYNFMYYDDGVGNLSFFYKDSSSEEFKTISWKTSDSWLSNLNDIVFGADYPEITAIVEKEMTKNYPEWEKVTLDYGGYSTGRIVNITSFCSTLNIENYPRYVEKEQNDNTASIEAKKTEVNKVVTDAADAVNKTFPNASSFKDVVDAISKQIKTPGSSVENQTETNLNVGTNALQPTGDVVVDSVKIFLTTLLKEGSNSLMTGLFNPTTFTVEEPETSDFDPNNYVDNTSTSSTCSYDATKFKIGEPCGNNGQCQTCCCTTNKNDGILYCALAEKCQ